MDPAYDAVLRVLSQRSCTSEALLMSESNAIIWIQVCKQYFLWGLQHVNITYFGLSASTGMCAPFEGGHV